MPDKYTYLLVDFCCLVVPFIFSFHPKINFHKQWKHLFIPTIVTALLFCEWDMLFTRWEIWSFNPRYICGIHIVNLPIEECLFFLFIPYCGVFTYHCITSFFNFDKYAKHAKVLSIILIVFLFVVAGFNLHKYYTATTFILLAVMLIFMIRLKAWFMPAFYFSFILILIPFFISNGILTGSFLAEPVVSYNPNHILGPRMFTIPVEDTFYGMLLLLANVAGFEYLKRRNAEHEPAITASK